MYKETENDIVKINNIISSLSLSLSQSLYFILFSLFIYLPIIFKFLCLSIRETKTIVKINNVISSMFLSLSLYLTLLLYLSIYLSLYTNLSLSMYIIGN